MPDLCLVTQIPGFLRTLRADVLVQPSACKRKALWMFIPPKTNCNLRAWCPLVKLYRKVRFRPPDIETRHSVNTRSASK